MTSSVELAISICLSVWETETTQMYTGIFLLFFSDLSDRTAIIYIRSVFHVINPPKQHLRAWDLLFYTNIKNYILVWKIIKIAGLTLIWSPYYRFVEICGFWLKLRQKSTENVEIGIHHTYIPLNIDPGNVRNMLS